MNNSKEQIKRDIIYNISNDIDDFDSILEKYPNDSIYVTQCIMLSYIFKKNITQLKLLCDSNNDIIKFTFFICQKKHKFDIFNLLIECYGNSLNSEIVEFSFISACIDNTQFDIIHYLLSNKNINKQYKIRSLSYAIRNNNYCMIEHILKKHLFALSDKYYNRLNAITKQCFVDTYINERSQNKYIYDEFNDFTQIKKITTQLIQFKHIIKKSPIDISFNFE